MLSFSVIEGQCLISTKWGQRIMKGAVCRISLSGLRVAPNKYTTIQYPLRLSFSLPYYVNPPLLSGKSEFYTGTYLSLVDRTDKFSSSQANHQAKEWLSILQILAPNGDCVNRSSHGTAAITRGKLICPPGLRGVTCWSNQMAASCPEYILTHKLRVFSFIGRHLKDSALRFKMRT